MSQTLKRLNKYYIKQYVINDYSFQAWSESLGDLLKDDKIVGYMFNTIKTKGFEPSKILNLYLIKRKFYQGAEISLDTLEQAWKLFLSKATPHTTPNDFHNPPIELWLDTKDNWCKKLASKLGKQFDMSYNEALSNVYMTIVKCYSRNDVYMGSLNYIQRSAYNEVLNGLRYNKNRVNLDSGKAISMSTVLGISSDGEEILLEDVLQSEEDNSEASLSYRETLESCKKLLGYSFSPREIEQIILLDGKQSKLPINLYTRLLRWRMKHNTKEIYND